MFHVGEITIDDRGQAVILPPEFSFPTDVKEVSIRRDAATGDVILSLNPLPATWDSFLSPEERNQGFHDRDPFAGWEE